MTAANTGTTLSIAFNYGGRAENVDAVKDIAREVRAGTLRPEGISETDASRSACTLPTRRPRSARPHERGATDLELPPVGGGLLRALVNAGVLAGLRPRDALRGDPRFPEALAALRRRRRQTLGDPFRRSVRSSAIRPNPRWSFGRSEQDARRCIVPGEHGTVPPVAIGVPATRADKHDRSVHQRRRQQVRMGRDGPCGHRRSRVRDHPRERRPRTGAGERAGPSRAVRGGGARPQARRLGSRQPHRRPRRCRSRRPSSARSSPTNG